MPPPRVLIADADDDRQAAYRAFLTADGFEVTTARDALDCIRRLRECVPEVLVLDLSLPWGGGDGVLARISEDARLPRVLVIVLSTGDDVMAAPRLWEFPISEFHSHPVSPPLLARRIRLQLASRATEAAL